MISLKNFFKFEKYHHPHKRHDSPGSEDADVNNDGKVDKNDKYIMAKRRLYRQYQATQKSTKSTEFSTPKLENNMIKLSGLVNLKALKEESHEEPTSTPIKPVDKAKVEMKLKKLKEMQMDKEQEKKIDELLSKMEELTAKQKQLDVDKDGKIEGGDLAKLRAKKNEEIGPKDQLDTGEYDYEGDMAKNQLQTVIRHAQELHDMLEDDTNLPEWVQGKITLAKEYIQSAADYISSEKSQTDAPVDKDMTAMKEKINEAAPEGWEKTVLAMKKHKEIDNPWALANWMKKKGYKPQNENVDTEEDAVDEIGMVKKAVYMAKAARDIVRQKGRQKDAQKQADAPPRIGVKGKETPASARDRTAAAKVAAAAGKKVDKRVKGIDTARGFKGPDTAKGAKVKNPETGKEILATTAAKDSSHPAHSAAKSALGKKK